MWVILRLLLLLARHCCALPLRRGTSELSYVDKARSAVYSSASTWTTGKSYATKDPPRARRTFGLPRPHAPWARGSSQKTSTRRRRPGGSSQFRRGAPFTQPRALGPANLLLNCGAGKILFAGTLMLIPPHFHLRFVFATAHQLPPAPQQPTAVLRFGPKEKPSPHQAGPVSNEKEKCGT